jgi:uncharacterized membrane protein
MPMAFLTVAIATVEAFVTGLWAAFPASTANRRMRQVWPRYCRWPVAGLTLHLAAASSGESIAPTWEEVGKLRAIAAIQTFLNFFLERDLVAARGVVSSFEAFRTPASESLIASVPGRRPKTLNDSRHSLLHFGTAIGKRARAGRHT